MPIFPPPPPPPNFRPIVRPPGNGMTADEKSRYARERHLFQNKDGTWNKKDTLPCTPELPNGFVLKRYEDNRGGGGGDGSTKTAITSIFTDAFFLALPDYEIEALLSLKSLTGNEILQVAHRENFYTTNAVLNSNILDIVDSKNFYSPTQIIKLQNPDLSYFQNNLGAYRVSLTSSVVTINIPSPGIDQSFKVEVETFAPKSIKNDTIYTL
jgi:hypothetical protein